MLCQYVFWFHIYIAFHGDVDCHSNIYSTSHTHLNTCSLTWHFHTCLRSGHISSCIGEKLQKHTAALTHKSHPFKAISTLPPHPPKIKTKVN